MENDIFDQGLTLMLVGMGTVFTFLAVLVLAMSLMSLVIRRMSKTVAATGVSDEEVAAISAALTMHRKK